MTASATLPATATPPEWSAAGRGVALALAAREGVDVLVIGGGITGAGVLRDAATRGLTAMLVEREDFAAGTSSYSSKLVHGGLRYLAEGQVRVTRESCRERDLLMRQLPNLVRPLPFLFPCWDDSKIQLWKLRTALVAYSAVAGFGSSSRFSMLDAGRSREFCPALRPDGLRGAALYKDGQVDDARLVLETLKSARQLGAEAVNHAEAMGFETGERGRIRAVRVRDTLGGGEHRIRASAVVNAAGPGLERVRSLQRPLERPNLRPAKGVHLVLPRERVPTQGVVTFEAPDGRHLFVIPWDEVTLLGTTDAFTDEVDEPAASIDEAHYLLSAANDAFPSLALTTNDVRCAFAGVRPLVAGDDEEAPSSSVSRDSQVSDDGSGLISAAGGKLTTYRAMAEKVMRRVLEHLPEERRRRAGPSRTAAVPLREDDFPVREWVGALSERHGIEPVRAAHLVRAHGLAAEQVLAGAEAEELEPVGRSRYLFAEVRYGLQHEGAATLCDLLQRRMRLAIFTLGQGLGELDALARVAGRVAGWDEERTREEARRYIDVVRRRYQIAPSASSERSASSSRAA